MLLLAAMSRRPLSSRNFEARYWHHVRALDTFWRQTFVAFVAPLKGLYVDPVSAGAAILSRYLEDPMGVGKKIASEPDTFGALVPHSMLTAKTIAARLQNPSSGISLRQCAALFAAAREASAELDLLRAENPGGYRVLQRQRAFERRK